MCPSITALKSTLPPFVTEELGALRGCIQATVFPGGVGSNPTSDSSFLLVVLSVGVLGGRGSVLIAGEVPEQLYSVVGVPLSTLCHLSNIRSSSFSLADMFTCTFEALP